MPDDAPRIIGYIRVSTEEQADEGFSLAAQTERLELACRFKGWQLLEVIADEGITGTSVEARPGFKRALRMIAKGQADGLVTSKLDRLSRSRNDTDAIFEWFKEAGAVLCVLDIDGLDTSTAIGQAMLGIVAVMAQLYRDTIAENTTTVLRHKRAKGQRVGRPGVHEMPALQRRIHRLRNVVDADRGRVWTWQEIADQLNLEGVPTLRGAKQWRVSSVQTAGGYVRPPQRKAATKLPALPRRRSR